MADSWLWKDQWGHVQGCPWIVKCEAMPQAQREPCLGVHVCWLQHKSRPDFCPPRRVLLQWFTVQICTSGHWWCSWPGSRECQAHSRSRPCHGVCVAGMKLERGRRGLLDAWACSQKMQKQTSYLLVAWNVQQMLNLRVIVTLADVAITTEYWSFRHKRLSPICTLW